MSVAEIKTIELVNIVYDYLVGLNDINLSPFLTLWPPKPYNTRIISLSSLPVLSYLPKLCEDEDVETGKIVKILQTSAEYLSWRQTYSTDDFGSTFLNKYGWTELIGLRGPVISDDIACGFLLLGPNLEYPKHSHESVEVYVPLTSKAQWMRGNEDWVLKPRGVPIHHKSWLTHGIRTGSTPLLALYLWYGGDLAQKSQID